MAASTLLGAAALAIPVLARNGDGHTMGRYGVSGSGMWGVGRMTRHEMSRGDMTGMCGEMMDGTEGGGWSGRPNEQWRHAHVPEHR